MFQGMFDNGVHFWPDHRPSVHWWQDLMSGFIAITRGAVFFVGAAAVLVAIGALIGAL